MDKKIQRYLIVLFMIAGPVFGQCKKEINIVETDSCTKVQMSADIWAYYYKANKNLEAIKDSMPKLFNDINKERLKAEQKSVSLEKQIEIQKKVLDLEKESKEECVKTVAIVELENTHLRKENKFLKKLPKWCFFGGGIIGGFFVGVVKK
jgi:hypothetical protein